MRRTSSVTVVQLIVVVQVLIIAGIANAQTKKVACVGDSITALPSGWCGYLGMKLGSGYMAQTFGVSGTTLLKNVPQPAYSSSAQYKPSHDFAPNIVVIMLGTNDSAPRNWNAGKDHFVKDYEELIDSYTSLASKPMVFLNTAPPASDNNMFTISGMTIEKEVNPLIKQVAMNKMCPLVDVWAALGGDVTKLGGGDGVHPGASGSMLIAEAVSKAIMSPMIPGGSAGMGAVAGAGGGSANAGAGGSGQAGVMAIAGAGATVTAGGSANADGAGAGAAGTTNASGAGAGGANTGASAMAGSRANAAGSTSTAGAAGSATAGRNSSIVNAVGTAGGAAVASAAASSGGGCRAAGDSTSGAATALLVLLGLVIRRRKNRTRPLRASDASS